MKLRHELISGSGSAPTKSVFLLHGILGAGINLRSLAKRFVALRPGWQAVIVDVRAHGSSLEADGQPDTVETAAADVAELARQLTVPACAAVGHSFGGKVSLELARHVDAPLEHVALIDSAPGTRFDYGGSDLTVQVLALLDSLAGETWATRDEFVRHVMGRGLDRGVAQWLAMNVASENGRYRFVLELKRIHALLDSYVSLDAWSVLERPSTTRFHLIIGDRSKTYDSNERSRAHVLAALSAGRITVDVLPAGHWVHVDDFEGLLRVLAERIH